MGEDGLTSFSPLTAAATTALAVAGQTRYLAVWRVKVAIETGPSSAWDRIRRAAVPGPAYVYIPAFSLARPVMQRLGVRLTGAQPRLELTRGIADSALRPSLHQISGRMVGSDAAPERDGGVPGLNAEPDFGVLSPIVIGRDDAVPLAHFIYLAVESYEAKDLRSVDYELERLGEELVFVPAVWDPRHIHESNWRLLLREFDGLVA